VSAAAAGCGELRFQCAAAEERRVLRRLAGRDGSQGTSADNEVTVVGNSRSESRSVAGRTGTGTDGLRWRRDDAVVEERLESQSERE